ncbi:putative DNA methyltransferase protein [Rhizobium phage RHph_I4]|nr:putative DNA methyltransferase protein [Rhizobium phage RHph_I4]
MADKQAVNELRNIAVDLLDPDPRNAKEHTETQVDQICASINEYGFADPIGVIERPGGRYMIVEGHGRVLASKKLGLEEVPCIILPPMTENERKAYAIAHNQIQSITGLDMGVVADEFNRLEVGDSDYMSLGFTSEDVLFLLPDPMDSPGGSPDQIEGGDEEGYRSDSWKGFIPPVYKSNLRFNTEGDQLAFYQFVNVLRGRYLTAATIAERFVLFVQEFGGMEEEGEADADV